MAKFIIDCVSYAANDLIRYLRPRKWVISIEHGGAYHADAQYCQVWLETNNSLEWLDEYFDKISAAHGVVGVVLARLQTVELEDGTEIYL